MRWVLALLMAAVVATPAHAATTPRCYGAAARDPQRPCENRTLRLQVTPTPRAAPLIPGSPRAKLAAEGMVTPCAFGATAAQTTFALIGDSHAAHWRPTV